MSSTNIAEDERENYEAVVGKLSTYFKVRRNINYERAYFNLHNQYDGESAEQYITEIHKLAIIVTKVH